MQQQPPQSGYTPYQDQGQPGHASYPPPPPYQGQEQFGYSPYAPSYDPDQTQSIGKIALKYGLIFGAILIIMYLISVGTTRMINQLLMSGEGMPISTIALINDGLTVIFAIIYWIIYFITGLLASRRVQQQHVKAASITCLWATLCYFLVYALVLAINVFQEWALLPVRLRAFYFTSIGQGLIIHIVVYIGCGIGIGALGGLVGKSMARK